MTNDLEHMKLWKPSDYCRCCRTLPKVMRLLEKRCKDPAEAYGVCVLIIKYIELHNKVTFDAGFISDLSKVAKKLAGVSPTCGLEGEV